GDFALASNDCPQDPDPLAAGSACLLLVTFSPAAEGDRYGSLTFTGNFPGGALSIPLHGVGIARDFTISVTPSTLNTLQGDSMLPVTVSTSTIGVAGTIALTALSNDPGITGSFSPVTISSGGTSTMTISIAATVQAGYYGI